MAAYQIDGAALLDALGAPLDAAPKPWYLRCGREFLSMLSYVVTRGALVGFGAGALWVGYTSGDVIGYSRGFTAGCAVGVSAETCVLAQQIGDISPTEGINGMPSPTPSRLTPTIESRRSLCATLRSREHGDALAEIYRCE